MKSSLYVLFIAGTLALAACGQKASTPASNQSSTADSVPDVKASPATCADIAKVTDPKEHAALMDKCGLGSQTFKPSNGSWSVTAPANTKGK
jgi:entry exclusion lipoprotein TrbK